MKDQNEDLDRVSEYLCLGDDNANSPTEQSKSGSDVGRAGTELSFLTAGLPGAGRS